MHTHIHTNITLAQAHRCEHAHAHGEGGGEEGEIDSCTYGEGAGVRKINTKIKEAD